MIGTELSRQMLVCCWRWFLKSADVPQLPRARVCPEAAGWFVAANSTPAAALWSSAADDADAEAAFEGLMRSWKPSFRAAMPQRDA